MSATASSLSTHGAQSLSTRNARSVPAQARGFTWGRYALRGLVTVVAAVLANTLFYYIGSALVAYDSRFLPLASVGGAIIMTLGPAIVAVLLYAALRRFTHHPARIFTSLSAVALVVSFVPVVTYIPTVPGATDAQTAILAMMHVVAAAVIVGMLRRQA